MPKRVQSQIFRIVAGRMADGAGIVNEAFERLPKEAKESGHIKSHFSKLVGDLEESAHKLYREHEKNIGTEALMEYFGLSGPSIPVPIKLEERIRESFGELNDFFLALSQSRKSRAGKAFEIIIKRLFKSLGYPFDEQVVINGKPDFLLPSEKHYRVHATDCIIFTAKRTLRERWRQIVTEGIRGLGFYLATIDEKVTENGLREMNANRIYLVVTEHLKNIDHYKTAPNVITFEQFFRHHLDPAMQRWNDNGVIDRT
ncbi:MAG: type II restriction endonuclease [Deltaproteobacteria bacterium]|nr:type II restriction endonuclease [Deltaproteobacteria bacterium]